MVVGFKRSSEELPFLQEECKRRHIMPHILHNAVQQGENVEHSMHRKRKCENSEFSMPCKRPHIDVSGLSEPISAPMPPLEVPQHPINDVEMSHADHPVEPEDDIYEEIFLPSCQNENYVLVKGVYMPQFHSSLALDTSPPPHLVLLHGGSTVPAPVIPRTLPFRDERMMQLIPYSNPNLYKPVSPQAWKPPYSRITSITEMDSDMNTSSHTNQDEHNTASTSISTPVQHIPLAQNFQHHPMADSGSRYDPSVLDGSSTWHSAASASSFQYQPWFTGADSTVEPTVKPGASDDMIL
eukprot:GILK01003633.1.p1 GENE.GILK01003633.1~~GILK01003633.1.p1  ORF type:complete len:296 (+),score=19.82 GILK01003633.1:112-999(+)